ncbi:9835_t:CDS:2, partial [Funneliformis geosporum]
NMATLPEVFNSMAPLLAQILQYIGHELPDDYYNHIMQAINYGNSLGVVGFDNAMKTNVLAEAGRCVGISSFNEETLSHSSIQKNLSAE